MTTTAAKPKAASGAATPPPDEAPAPPAPIPADVLAQMSLAERLAHITAEVGPVAKGGRNQHFGYSYQRAEDVAAAVAPLLGRYGVSITPSIVLADMQVTETGRTTKGGSPIRDYAVPVIFTIDCGDTNRVVPWVGLSTDDSDKGVNKAITAAVKSFLRAQFLIPTDGDDTDSGGVSGGGGGTGEVIVPKIIGEVTGSLLWAEDGSRMAFQYRTDEDADFDAMKDAVKSIGGRWNKEEKLWLVPTGNAAAAVVIARAAGLKISAELAERFPAEPAQKPADDLAPPAAQAAQGSPADDDDIPF